MKFLPLLLFCSGAIYAADSIDVFGMHWTVPLASEWKVEQDGLHLITTRGPDPKKPRRPQQFALSDKEYGSFQLEADVKVLQRSLIVVYAYKDEAHFNYAHLSTDTGAKQPVHNGIFHVFGGERVRISSTEGPPSFAATDEWNHVTVKYDAKGGKLAVLVNGKANPSVTAVDLSLASGKVGLGSFDETAVFKNVKITPASNSMPQEAARARTLGDYFRLRENNFNFIRLAASLLVIYGHSYAVVKAGGADLFTRLIGWGFSGGLAVDMFFVISGFLVTASALKGDWRFYVASRVLRIFPGLALCVTLTVFVLGPLLTIAPDYWSSPQIWRYWIHNGAAITTEYTLPGVFADHRDKALNGVLWSVIIEVRLYIMVLALFFLGVLQRRSLFNVLAICTLTIGYLAPSFNPLHAGSTDLHVASLFLIGMFCWINREALVLNEFILLGLLAVAAIALQTDKFVVAYSLLVPYAVFMIAFAPGLGWFRRLGDYSYGVYLYGWPVQQCVLLLDPNMEAWKNALYSCAIALGFGVVSWHFFESPILALKKKLQKPTSGLP